MNLAVSEKSRKDLGGLHHNYEPTSSKQHGPRFSSNHPRDRFVVPSIWSEKDKTKQRGGRHGGESVGSGGGRAILASGPKGQMLKATKKSKPLLFDGQSSQRLDAMTPHLPQRNSAEQLDLDHKQSKKAAPESASTKLNRFKR